MGRTGRKREGRIVVLVTEGAEERKYNTSLLSKKAINKVKNKTGLLINQGGEYVLGEGALSHDG
jgi:ERCC4-related helicase